MNRRAARFAFDDHQTGLLFNSATPTAPNVQPYNPAQWQALLEPVRKAPKPRLRKEYNPEEPRDEKGQWTAEGASEGSKGAAQELLARHWDKSVTVQDVLNRAGPVAQQAYDKAVTDLAAAVPTTATVAQGGYKNPDGTWTAERQQLHQDIVRSYFTPQAVADATPPPGTKPTLTLLGGRGGCLSGDHEFLTPHGWKRIDAYERGDEVLTVDIVGNASWFEKPSRYVVLPSDGFYHFKARGLDMMLSPEHVVPFVKKYNRSTLRSLKAAEIVAQHLALKEGWDGLIPCAFPAPANTRGVPLSEAQLRLMVAVCADGNFALTTTRRCRVSVSKPRKQKRLEELLNACGIPFKIHERASRGGKLDEARYSFDAPHNNKSLAAYWSATPEQLCIIVEELLHWDGWKDRFDSWIFTSTNRADIDFVSYAFSTQGRRSSFYCDERLDHETWRPIWRVSGARNGGFAGMRYASQKPKIDFVQAGESKYCFTVSTGFFVTRRNDCICVTGNSGKTWLSSGDGPVDPVKSIILNNDDIKAALGFHGWDAAMYHDESNEVAGQIEAGARAMGLNLAVEGTMRTPANAEALADVFTHAGYNTEAYYMFVPPQEAATRAMNRFVGVGNKDAGRFVPPDIILNSTSNESTFDRISSRASKWGLYTNLGPPGSTPSLYAKGGNW